MDNSGSDRIKVSTPTGRRYYSRMTIIKLPLLKKQLTTAYTLLQTPAPTGSPAASQQMQQPSSIPFIPEPASETETSRTHLLSFRRNGNAYKLDSASPLLKGSKAKRGRKRSEVSGVKTRWRGISLPDCWKIGRRWEDERWRWGGFWLPPAGLNQ